MLGTSDLSSSCVQVQLHSDYVNLLTVVCVEKREVLRITYSTYRTGDGGVLCAVLKIAPYFLVLDRPPRIFRWRNAPLQYCSNQ